MLSAWVGMMEGPPGCSSIHRVMSNTIPSRTMRSSPPLSFRSRTSARRMYLSRRTREWKDERWEEHRSERGWRPRASAASERALTSDRSRAKVDSSGYRRDVMKSRTRSKVQQSMWTRQCGQPSSVGASSLRSSSGRVGISLYLPRPACTYLVSLMHGARRTLRTGNHSMSLVVTWMTSSGSFPSGSLLAPSTSSAAGSDAAT
mmetsp:Transcript_13003/g.38197  ORF Transcript_13003/g.38197 Transcript_13003/m.38197 type:complete len:203 (+) Transcript_13003:677-1285(+)